MKTKVYIYALFFLGFSQMFSQELSELKLIDTEQPIVNLNATNEDSNETISLITVGSDLFTLNVFNYAISDLSLSINTRLEEELPYESNSYDYAGFYYLDFSCSYAISDFSFSLSLENLLNFNSKDFSIDPNLETSNGIINEFYLSHEADALVSVSIAYNF